MDRRLQLHEKLKELAENENVYFQPPPNLQMKYPAIVYKLDNVLTTFADNSPYNRRKRWEVTVIDEDIESLIPDRIGEQPLSSFNRFFVSNNLNHTVYSLYF